MGRAAARGNIALPVFGVILAGGRGQRMGGTDKAALMLAGRPMLIHVRDRIVPQVAALALSSNAGSPVAGAADLAMLADPVLPGVPERPGPLAGILAGLDWAAQGGADWLASVPVDTPFLPADLVARLLDAAVPGRPVLAESAGRLHPTAAIWPVAAADGLRAALIGGERRVRAWAMALGAGVVAFPSEGRDPFFNVNTPADLALAESLLTGTAPQGGTG